MPRQRGFLSVPAASLAAGILLLLGPATAPADDYETQDAVIDQIVVVAHKDERSIRDVAANITVISGAAMRDELVSSIDEVFRYVPGLDYEAAGTRFGAEGINIRGIGGNRIDAPFLSQQLPQLQINRVAY